MKIAVFGVWHVHAPDYTRKAQAHGEVIGFYEKDDALAEGYAKESGIPLGTAFIKNRYIGRTFIVPGQDVREDKVKIKLNVIADTVKGKRVVLVDDSIVRGTTSAIIVRPYIELLPLPYQEPQWL